MSEPHQRSGSFFIGPGEDTASQTFTVLADRRLSIEYISGLFALPPGQQPFLAQVRTTVGEVEATHHFRLEPLQSENRFHFGGPVALYADPSSEVEIIADRIPDDLGSARLIWTLSGRLEDVENPA